MRLTTWNVNGIRNPFSYQPWNTARTFPAMFDILGSDIVVMQELKIQRKDLRDDMVLLDGWDCYFSLPKHKKGYSGVGIYTRNATCAPIRAEEGLLGVLPSPNGLPYRDLEEGQNIGGYPSLLQITEIGVDPALLDAEGRCVIVEFPAFVLLGVYSPANSNGLRDDFRYGFICALDCRIRNLIRLGKRVILVGDLNVSRDELDTASAVEDMRKSGITHEDYISTPNRRVFNQLLVGGEVVGERDEGREQGVLWDTTRGFHPDRKGMYTHWEQKINARPGNFGGRIDFVLVSDGMRSWIRDANIQEGLLGSDHCPVYVDFRDLIQLSGEGGEETPLADIMSPIGFVVNGKRVREWKVQSAPAFSAKKMPEFDKRRSIKSMFAAPAIKKQATVDMHHNSSGAAHSTPLITGAEEPATNDVTPSQSTISQSPVKQSPAPSPARKRKSSAQTAEGSNGLKRQKSDLTQQVGKATKGQQSMKTFFQTKTQESPQKLSASDVPAAKQQTSLSPKHENGTAANHTTTAPSLTTAPAPDISTSASTPSPPSPSSPTSSIPDIHQQIATAEQTQRSWSSLFSRPAAPLCEGHSEPCKSMQTKKKGSNQGRSFWMCARPLGPSGNKERGTGWRCPTFIWCSEWGGGKERTAKGDEEMDREDIGGEIATG